MPSAFESVAATESAWQAARDLDQHTLLDAAAERVVAGHLHFLTRIIGWQPGPDALDLGAGAGHTTRAFRHRGIDMVASEHTDTGVALLQEVNPDMPVRKISMADYHQPLTHSLIFARELYPITRVGAFAEQHAMLNRLIDSLAPRGILLIIGSDIMAPDCMDYARMADAFRTDARLRKVHGPYLEPILIRRLLSCNALALALSHCLVRPLAAWKRRSGWAATNVIAFERQ